MLALLAAAAMVLAGPAEVLDGDTLLVAGARVRLEGVDAPELHQTCGATACGEISRAWLAEQVAGREVACAARVSDAHQRPIATCTVAGVDLSRAAVGAGMARSLNGYAPEQRAAKAAGAGHWASGDFGEPAAFRKAQAPMARAETRPGCEIKANLAYGTGERIAHDRASPRWAQTVIRPELGERIFCSMEEAVAAGWRPWRTRGPAAR